jgi:hypothetical protein
MSRRAIFTPQPGAHDMAPADPNDLSGFPAFVPIYRKESNVKKLLVAAAIGLTAFATPAMATAGATFNVTANVNAFCTTVTGSTTDLGFGTLTVGADGKLTGSYSASSTQANVVCNGANTTVTASSTAMTNSATLTDATNFTNTINYTPTVSLGTHSIVVDNAPHAVGEVVGTLTVGAGTLAPAGGRALLAGSYAGAIVVTLTPTA